MDFGMDGQIMDRRMEIDEFKNGLMDRGMDGWMIFRTERWINERIMDRRMDMEGF